MKTVSAIAASLLFVNAFVSCQAKADENPLSLIVNVSSAPTKVLPVNDGNLPIRSAAKQAVNTDKDKSSGKKPVCKNLPAESDVFDEDYIVTELSPCCDGIHAYGPNVNVHTENVSGVARIAINIDRSKFTPNDGRTYYKYNHDDFYVCNTADGGFTLRQVNTLYLYSVKQHLSKSQPWIVFDVTAQSKRPLK